MQKQKQKQNKTHAKPLQESKGKFKRKREKMNALSCPLSLLLSRPSLGTVQCVKGTPCRNNKQKAAAAATTTKLKHKKEAQTEFVYIYIYMCVCLIVRVCVSTDVSLCVCVCVWLCVLCGKINRKKCCKKRNTKQKRSRESISRSVRQEIMHSMKLERERRQWHQLNNNKIKA